MVSSLGPLVCFGVLSTWLTPVWLISLGTTLGLLVLLVLYALVWLVRRRTAREIPAVMQEGVLQPILYVLIFLAGLTLVAAVQMPYGKVLRSLVRLPAVGATRIKMTIPPGPEAYPVDVAFRPGELALYQIRSDRDLVVSNAREGAGHRVVLEVPAEEPLTWRKEQSGPLPFEHTVNQLYAVNQSDTPATVYLNVVTDVETPEVRSSVVLAALGTVALVLIYFLIRFAMPKISAIAETTSRQALSQPVFLLALILGGFALVSFVYVPYNTFGEDVKMLKDSGLTLIMVLSIIVALWTASVSVAEEIEGRTALTLLSKPISRRQFILGKFLGIVWPVVLLFVCLGLLFLATVSYKVVYDARETVNPNPNWQLCYEEMIRIVPGLLLAFMEAVVLASISVAISTRLPMLANLVICSSIYVMGHLVPLIVESSVGAFEAVRFVGLLIATIFPVLDHFNIQAAVATGQFVPLAYLGWALAYAVLYSTIMMLLALVLFEDRDLA